jgi:hypothetical protein
MATRMLTVAVMGNVSPGPCVELESNCDPGALTHGQNPREALKTVLIEILMRQHIRRLFKDN